VAVLLRWFLNALSLFAISYFAPVLGVLPGFKVEGIEAAAFAVAILSILNLTVKPILKILALPITCLTFGLFALIINALMMLLTSRIVRGFEVGSFWNALIASVIFAIVSAILNSIFKLEED